MPRTDQLSPSALKRLLLPRGFRRTLRHAANQMFHRVTKDEFTSAFRRLRIPDGAIVGVHSRLSGFGHLVGGPQSVIAALREAIPDCTLIMPTFPFPASMAAYLERDPVFDPDLTPSCSGLLSETLRCFPGTLRSRHPTHPSAALGPKADLLISGSEHSPTPFGDDSAYGRYCDHEDAYHLLLDTNHTSIVHRFQELVGMPNLFLPDPYPAKYLAPDGTVQTTHVRVHVPTLPLHVRLTDPKTGHSRYLWLPDYALPFPPHKRLWITQRLRSLPDLRARLLARHDSLLEAGVLRTTQLGKAALAAAKIKPWEERIVRDLRSNLADEAEAYSHAAMQAAASAGLLASSP